MSKWRTLDCDPRGTYNDAACPVCGDVNSSTLGECQGMDDITEWRKCNVCGTEYVLRWRLASISIKED